MTEAGAFILPSVFTLLVSIWYVSFLSQANALEGNEMHLFTALGRLFYGSLLSLPFEPLLQVILSRSCVWVFVFLLAVDISQAVSIVLSFNHFSLSSALSLLMSGFFGVVDLFFIVSAYRLSVFGDLVPRCTEQPVRPDIIADLSATPLRFINKGH